MSKEVAADQYVSRDAGFRERPLRTAERRLKRKVPLVAAVLVLARLAELLQPMADDAARMIGDLTRPSTQQEAEIAGVINKVMGTGDEIVVRCRPNLYQDEGSGGRTYGIDGFYLPLITFDQKRCDVLSSISREEPYNRTYDSKTVSSTVRIAAHEGSHYKYEETNESVVVCYAVQHAANMALGFGADPREAERIALASVMYVYPEEHQPEYGVPEGCVPGGVYDLGIPGMPGGYHDIGYFPLQRELQT